MSGPARVESIDALRLLRQALLKFAETCTVALDDAEGELQRTMVWLETEQRAYWDSEARKAAEAVSRAKEAVRMKKLFKDSTGGRSSAVDEEKALAAAQRRLDECQWKINAVKQHTQRLRKEILSYKGGVQRFNTALGSDVPTATAYLDQLMRSLEAYVNLAAPTAEAAAITADAEGSMARPADEPPPEEPKPEEKKEAADGNV